MIEAVNSVLSNSPITRIATEQQSVVSSFAANPDRVQVVAQAPYISPYIHVDVNFDKAVLQIRDAAILREKDVMQEEEANTPCKKVYFLIQCMYLANTPKEYHQMYFNLVKEIQHAAPSLTPLFLEINECIMSSHYYKAMKGARNLITFEEELLGHATGKAATAE